MLNILDFNRKFSKVLTRGELDTLSQVDFLTYLRESLWNRLAKKEYKKKFDELTWIEKNHVDLLALIKIGKAFEEIRSDKAPDKKI